MTDNISESDSDETTPHQSSNSVLYETGPSLRPAIVKFILAVISGACIVAYLLTHPQLFGSQQNTEIGTYVVILVIVILLIRYAVRIYMLKQYRYLITNDGVRWEYSLFYKTQSRELPFNKIRGYEFQQDRIQSFFGFGTISLLSGGTNQSLGFIRFENIAASDDVQSIIRENINDE